MEEKGVGSQGDGSIQFLAKDEKCQQQIIAYLNGLGMSAYALTLKARHTIRKRLSQLRASVLDFILPLVR